MNGTVNIRELNDLIASKSNIVNLVTQGMNQRIVGQKHLVDSLLIALCQTDTYCSKVCLDWLKLWQ